jgi:hypothetical protein
LDYGFLPQNVGKKTEKQLLLDPKVQIITRRPLLQSEDGSLVRPVVFCVEPMYNRI